jgi:hypothetical protein
VAARLASSRGAQLAHSLADCNALAFTVEGITAFFADDLEIVSPALCHFFPGSGRRHDRIARDFAAMHLVCFWHKADMAIGFQASQALLRGGNPRFDLLMA